MAVVTDLPVRNSVCHRHAIKEQPLLLQRVVEGKSDMIPTSQHGRKGDANCAVCASAVGHCAVQCPVLQPNSVSGRRAGTDGLAEDYLRAAAREEINPGLKCD